MSDEKNSNGQKNTRRDAIKRLGILGVGAVVAGRASRTSAEGEYSSQAPYVSCTYYSCWDFYQSQSSYNSSEGVDQYASINSYSSTCTCMQ